MSDGKKVLTVIFVLLTLALTSLQITRRVTWDENSKNYSIITGYRDLSRAASLYGETEVELAERLQEKGLNLVLFKTDLVKDGELNSPEAAAKLRRAGLGVGLEAQNLQIAGHTEFMNLLQTMKELEPAYLLLRGIGAVDIPPALTDWMKKHQVVLGTVEFRNQGTTRDLVEEFGFDHVRLHRVFDEETGTLTETERVARYVRAVEERNIGAIEYRLPLDVGANEQLNPLGSIREELGDLGYRSVPPDQAKGTGGIPGSPFWLTLLLIVSSIGAGVLILIMGRQLRMRTLLGAVLLLFIAVGAGLIAIPVLTKQVAGLVIALAAPLLAFLLLRRYGLTVRSSSVPGATYLDFLGISLFSTFAGLVVSSIFLDELFLLKLYQFRGVKVSLFLPLAFLVVLAFYSGEFKVSDIRFSYGKILAGLAMLGLFFFLLVRSGNFNFLRTTDLEEALRRWLDSAFFIRPRFKEFLIGHPAMIAWLYLSGHHRDRFQFCKLGFFVLGFIGQISIINTFVHVHTPITVSLIRTANGLAGGLILGTGLLVLIVWGVYLWNLQKR